MLTPFLLAATLSLDPRAAERFANLALACVHQEYPNKVAHVLQSECRRAGAARVDARVG